MFYIHNTSCICSQQTFGDVNLSSYLAPAGNKLLAIEPPYTEIPEKILRRMGKAVRLGVGAAMPVVVSSGNPDGVIIGTANGGMEDCIKFLNQIIEYEEGMLTPTNFVQSTANAVAGQVGLLLKNRGYNITHVHRGHSFENAMLDAAMYLSDNRDSQLLLGAVDEISAYNYNIDLLAGWFKTAAGAGAEMYGLNDTGSYPGEGSAMFYVSAENNDGAVKLEALTTVTTENIDIIKDVFRAFLLKHELTEVSDDSRALNDEPMGKRDYIFLSGENGDTRLQPYYDMCENLLHENTPVARFKHISGEFATASAIALWLCCDILRTKTVPRHMWKRMPGAPKNNVSADVRKILMYNNHKGLQHTFMICSVEA
jgi:beta-ketoacyl synthase-like protein